MEIHTVGAMLMHADRRTDGWTEVMKLMVDFATMRMHLKVRWIKTDCGWCNI